MPYFSALHHSTSNYSLGRHVITLSDVTSKSQWAWRKMTYSTSMLMYNLQCHVKRNASATQFSNLISRQRELSYWGTIYQRWTSFLASTSMVSISIFPMSLSVSADVLTSCGCRSVSSCCITVTCVHIVTASSVLLTYNWQSTGNQVMSDDTLRSLGVASTAKSEKFIGFNLEG